MSTFSGLSTSMSSLIAQRQAMEVTGQNIANANTVGYTRQRVDLQSVDATAVPSMSSTPSGAGNGVTSAGIARLGDNFLDARLRTQTSQASRTAADAKTLSRLESVVTEPSDTGLAAGLQQFWTTWEDVANTPDSSATRSALIGKAAAFVNQVTDTYKAYQGQWDQARTEGASLVSQVNTTATSIADLNNQIRGVLVSGGSANELIDKRSVLITQLSSSVGASSREMPDGTVNVMVSGNPLVSGDRAQRIQMDGAFSMGPATQEPPSATDVIRLSWSSTGTPLVLDGGSLASTISSLQPASTGGAIADALSKINDLATNVATAVNTIHSGGQTLAAPPNDTGVNFFSLAAGVPAALGLKVAITDPNMVAAANGANGTLDGSVADHISQLREGPTSPDASWRQSVVELGVKSAAAKQRADVSEASRASAENLQTSGASVDVDGEMTNMLSFQRAYQGSARVLTAIDSMLDTLINRTGMVGR